MEDGPADITEQNTKTIRKGDEEMTKELCSYKDIHQKEKLKREIKRKERERYDSLCARVYNTSECRVECTT